MLHPGQFEVNEAWVAFRLNDAPIHTERDGDFDCIALIGCSELLHSCLGAHSGGNRSEMHSRPRPPPIEECRASQAPATQDAVRPERRTRALDVENRFVRNGLYLVPQITIYRVAEGVFMHVCAHAVATSPNEIPEKSIAVLPFVDMSEKHDQEYFRDRMAEEIRSARPRAGPARARPDLQFLLQGQDRDDREHRPFPGDRGPPPHPLRVADGERSALAAHVCAKPTKSSPTAPARAEPARRPKHPSIPVDIP